MCQVLDLPGVGVAQLVSEVLDLVCRETVVVPETAVVGGPARPL